MSAPQPTRFARLAILFILSGASGLVYELVWTRELIFVFGGTTHAITTVLVAFMGGLGLGSYVAGRLAHRLAHAGRAYGVLEICIGIYALLLPLLFRFAEPIYRALYQGAGDHLWLLTAARFLISAMFMLVPTTLMGATLPVLVRHVAPADGRVGLAVGLLYGINTLGAVLGTTLAGFLLMPALGLTATSRLAAAANILIGLAALWLLRERSPQVARQTAADRDTERAAAPSEIDPSLRRAALAAFAFSGFAAMVYQVAWTRALVQVIGSSTYAFTCILSAFILGLAAGSMLMARYVDRLREPVFWIGVLQVVIGASALFVTLVYAQVPGLVYGIVERHSNNYLVLLAFQFAVVTAVTLVPTLMMGALYPLVTRTITAGSGDPAAAAGRAYGVNTLGTICGAFLAGFVMIRSDVLGAQYSIVTMAVLNGLLGALLLRITRTDDAPVAQRVGPAAAALVLVVLLASLSTAWDRQVMVSGPFRLGRDPSIVSDVFETRYLADGVDATVAVTVHRENPEAVTLLVNAKPDASTGLPDMSTQLLLGHLPSLLAEKTDNACVIGLGSGMTVAALTRYPQYRRIDCAEICEEVIKAHEYFAPFCYNMLGNIDPNGRDPRIEVIRADGRNHLLLTDRTYDVIVSEPTNPWIAGVANLFTLEYFELVDRRLSPGGTFCLWVQGYSTSEHTFRTILRTVMLRFPFVTMWRTVGNDYVLICGREPFRAPLARVAQRFHTPAVRLDLYRIAHGDLHRVLGRFITSGRPLHDWAAQGDIHTDDNAFLEFTAAREMYTRQPADIAASLFAIERSPFEEVLDHDPGEPWQRELAERIPTMFEARRLWLSWQRMQLEGITVEDAVANIFRAYALDPGNVEIASDLHDARGVLVAPGPAPATPTQIRILERIEALRWPTRAPLTGTDFDGLATYLRNAAETEVARKRYGNAVSYLDEARALCPGRPDIALDYLSALVLDGQGDRARAALAEALSGGLVSIETVRAAPSLSALLDGTAGPAPSTQPSSPDGGRP